MIIREKGHEFILIPQHDHAFLSGELAKHFDWNLLKSEENLEEVITAIYEHDRGWKNLDYTPLWSEEEEVPFSFANYPLVPKLAHYRLGLDEIQQMSAYAALLCSMHYCSFFSKVKDKPSIVFLKDEEKRQKQIIKELNGLDYELLYQHFRLLQLCDDLSLYVCLNEPGTNKENEHPWFKEGFRKSEPFNDGRHPLYSQWIDQRKVSVTRFPFVKEFQTHFNYKVVSKANITSKGLEQAFTTNPTQKQIITFTPGK